MGWSNVLRNQEIFRKYFLFIILKTALKLRIHETSKSVVLEHKGFVKLEALWTLKNLQNICKVEGRTRIPEKKSGNFIQFYSELQFADFPSAFNLILHH